MVRRLGLADNAFELVGALVDTSRSDVIEGVPVVGASRDASAVVAKLEVDAIAVAAWSTFSQLELRRLAWELEGTDVDVLVAPNLTDVAGPRLSIRPVAGLPLLHVDKPEFTGIRRVAKGLFDRGIALATLILLSPLLLTFVVAVRLDSPGPALFRQERVGRGGRTFWMLKFRSMRVDAERELDDVQSHNVHDKGPLFKAPDDPRITRVGRVLRRASLDELPQLWNVLRGQMSLVGPRPPLPGEVAQYAHDVYRRLLVKPGLTGLWQVSGRSDLTWDESVRLDLYYVENWSLFLDVSILMRTFRAVVAARGAY
jgi:exopolysaccharide biosynthesis polyprenyl glycosylphosphotransferase